MEFNRELLFFFSALGAFNGIVLSLYFLFYVKSQHVSNKFLGAFLLMLSIRIGKSVFFYFNPELSFHYLQFGLTACFFIGPFLFFYIKSVIQPESNINTTWKYHIAILLPIILIVGYVYPFKNNIDLWRPYIIKTIYLQWFVYLIASIYVIRPRIKALFNSTQKITQLDIWLFSILIGNLALLLAYYFTSFINYISGALTFSFLLYLLLLFLLFGKNRNLVLLHKKHRYIDKKMHDSQASDLIKQLGIIMAREEIYKNPNLKSSDVAKELDLSIHQFSQLLNDNLGKSFPVFINEYRITEAKNILLSNDQLTLEAIGYECGFNSKSTFYTAFKKIVGTTPAKFKKQF